MAPYPSPWLPAWVGSRRSTWLGGLALAAVVAAGAAVLIHRPMDVEVATVPVTVGPIVRRIVATGTVEAVTTVQVGAQISGTIRTIDVDFNSVVHKGQVLATLDPALLDATLAEAKGELLQRQAALAQAQADRMGAATAVEDAGTKLARAQQLAAGQLIPASDMDLARIAMAEAGADLTSAESRINEATAVVAEARAAVDQAQVNLDHAVIVSPIDGIVVARNVDVGQTVASTFQAPVLFNVATNLNRLKLDVHIDESDIGGIQAGEPVSFEVESYPDETFSGTVSEVRLQPIAEQTVTATTLGTFSAAPTTSDVPSVISYAAMVDVANPDERLRPGMTATVTLSGLRRDHALRVPNSALSFRPPPTVVEALRQTSDVSQPEGEPSSRPAMRRVWQYDGSRFTAIDERTGLSDDEWTELVSGPLREGDSLVTSAWLEARAR